MDLARRLEECEDFGCIFDLVKKSVQKTLKKDRAGLILALQRLPSRVGAYYPVGSNFIVLNKTLLERVMISYSKESTNSYVFYVLLHEYLHSLGYLNENMVMQLSYQICARVLGEGHMATRIAEHGIGHFISRATGNIHSETMGIEFEVIHSFDTEHMNYIG